MREKRGRRRRPPELGRLGQEVGIGQLRPFVEHVCDPQVETVHDHDIGLALERGESRRERDRNLDGAPGWGSLRLVAGDPGRHLLVPGLGRRDERDAPAVRPGASDGERALPRADAPQDEDGPRAHGALGRGLRLGEIACGNPGLPRRPVRSARVPGRSPDSRIVLLPAPFPARRASGLCLRVSSPITVTGSWRSRTAFPLGPSRGAHLEPRELGNASSGGKVRQERAGTTGDGRLVEAGSQPPRERPPIGRAGTSRDRRAPCRRRSGPGDGREPPS